MLSPDIPQEHREEWERLTKRQAELQEQGHQISTELTEVLLARIALTQVIRSR